MGSDPIERAAKGAAEGFLVWSEDKIKKFARQFKDRKIAFVQNPKTIETAKEQKKTSEYDFFENYVADGDLRILFQMGLTLRKVEKNKHHCNQLRQRIVNRYGAEGLHIAQFVQNGLFSKYFATLMERGLTVEQTCYEIKKFFDNIEITVSYIQNEDSVQKEAAAIITRIQGHSPNIYIISGSKSATQKCRQVKSKVMAGISGYTVEFYRTDITEIYFLTKSLIL